ncbi:MAG: hypothetical protein KDD48_01510 [Bdellovibrionales bacterium]|nr:hypothetical protein [Bdellovibrionales bacterium]
MFYLSFGETSIQVDSAIGKLKPIFKDRFNLNAGSTLSKDRIIRLSIKPCEQTTIDFGKIPKSFQWIRNRPLWGHLDKTFYLTDGVSLAITDYANRSAIFYIHNSTLDDFDFFWRSFLLIPLLELLKYDQYFYVHGALVKKDDQSVLLLGKGGSGKSTSSGFFIKHGWSWVSDDNMLLQAGPGFPRLLAFEREISLWPDSIKRLKFDFIIQQETKKLRIPHRQITSHMSLSAPMPKLIILLSDSPSSNPISLSSVFSMLLGENPALWINQDTFLAAVNAYRRLLRNATIHSLYRPNADQLMSLAASAYEGE